MVKEAEGRTKRKGEGLEAAHAVVWGMTVSDTTLPQVSQAGKGSQDCAKEPT